MIDEATYRETSEMLLPTLYRIAMSILHSDADAQDAVQQALLKAWAHREKAAPDNYRAYLTRIAVNECRNIQRYRQRVLPVDEVREGTAYAQEDNSGLYEAIGGLPEKLRITLLLKYMEGYKEREIAQALHISLPAVKNRLFRARHELRRTLSKEVVFE